MTEIYGGRCVPGNDPSFVVTIEKLIAGGIGLGRRPDGMVVLVPLVLPEEEVRLTAIKRKRDYLFARLLEVITPSPHRVQPPCPYYGRCGGCDLQHATPDYQLKLKTEMVLESLGRISPYKEEALARFLAPIIPSPLIFHYRQRLRLKVEKGKVGLRRPRSHSVCPIRTCLLARPEINVVLQGLFESDLAFPLLEYAEELELMVSPDDGAVYVLLHLRRQPDKRERIVADQVCKDIAAVQGVSAFFPDPSHRDRSRMIRLDREGTPGILRFTLSASDIGGFDLVFSFAPGVFCQVNQAQNENLVRLVLEWACLDVQGRVLDLFCGMGNFSLPLARHAKEVTGYDLSNGAILWAKRNMEGAKITNCRFYACSAEQGIEAVLKQGRTYDCVVLDPPRVGCADIIRHLRAVGARRIIYISCDTVTLARDLARLADHGYIPRRLQPLDMFPQTHHLETATLLELAEKSSTRTPQSMPFSFLTRCFSSGSYANRMMGPVFDREPAGLMSIFPFRSRPPRRQILITSPDPLSDGLDYLGNRHFVRHVAYPGRQGTAGIGINIINDPGGRTVGIRQQPPTAAVQRKFQPLTLSFNWFSASQVPMNQISAVNFGIRQNLQNNSVITVANRPREVQLLKEQCFPCPRLQDRTLHHIWHK